MLEGVKTLFWKRIEEEKNLARCWLVPTNKYSVLDGLTERRFAVSQAWIESRVEESMAELEAASELENEI